MPQTDILIIGGGPAGSTVGSLVKKYAPELDVTILEREHFPRDHVGESQLPGVSAVLHEMGCWDKVEAANFPVKVGATYLWGKSEELWDFDFAPRELFGDLPRPAQYEGIRPRLAFQVDRAIYDEILLDHAAALGCRVKQGVRATQICTEGDRITAVRTDEPEEISARFYVDASGHAGIIRRSLGVPADAPTHLQNVAVWDYWRNATWAKKIGVGGTYVQVVSVGYGWIWFIPLGPDRTSVGLIVPVEYLKSSGKTLAELYATAIHDQPRIAALMKNASSENKLQSTKDWSFLARRQTGENWFLAGEACGFADPILAAGMGIAHFSAREVAFSLIEALRGGDLEWLRAQYEHVQSRRISNHIRFADYWYTANSQFTELKEFTAKIAEENGLKLSPDKAWAWLAQGGFIDEGSFNFSAGTFDITLVKQLGEFVGETQNEFEVLTKNVFEVDLEGAHEEARAQYAGGSVVKVNCWVRDGQFWPLFQHAGFWFDALQPVRPIAEIKKDLIAHTAGLGGNQAEHIFQSLMYLEALIAGGWVKASFDPEQRPFGGVKFNTVLIKNDGRLPEEELAKI